MGDQPAVRVPETGLIAMRIALEFGSAEQFAETFSRAVVRGGAGGATLTARLDLGDLAIHIPSDDGPAWNVVPLLHLLPGDELTDADWAAASAILEKLERYR